MSFIWVLISFEFHLSYEIPQPFIHTITGGRGSSTRDLLGTLYPDSDNLPRPRDQVLGSTQFIYLNGTTTSGPSLPHPREGHCILEYTGDIFSETIFFLSDQIQSAVLCD